MEHLFTVEDVFILDGRIVLVPGVDAAHRVLSGSRLQLRRPNGSTVTATVGGVEIPSPNPQRKCRLWIRFLVQVEKE